MLGNSSRLDMRGVLWTLLGAQLCLPHLEAGGRGQVGGEECVSGHWVRNSGSAGGEVGGVTSP